MFYQRLFFFICSILALQFNAAAGGLKRLVVEKYHKATPEEVAASKGRLTLNSITYRIYVELLPGYKFIDAFGSKAHPLKITTSTYFYNHPKGGRFGNAISPETIKNDPLVALDSWLSVGVISSTQLGVVNGTSVEGTPGEVTVLGLDKQLQFLSYSDDSVKTPVVFETTNGAWACLKGATGPSADNNTVLVAQLTTDGALALGLNFVIGTPPGSGGSGGEYYVVRDPNPNELQLPPPTFILNPLFKP